MISWNDNQSDELTHILHFNVKNSENVEGRSQFGFIDSPELIGDV